MNLVAAHAFLRLRSRSASSANFSTFRSRVVWGNPRSSDGGGTIIASAPALDVAFLLEADEVG